MTGKVVPFNPLDKRSLAQSIVRALLLQPYLPLSQASLADGAGLYALYYRGTHSAYQPLVERRNGQSPHPIYVGKAIPEGGRKGWDFDSGQGRALGKRIAQHEQSIGQVNNLSATDFLVQVLSVDDVWIGLGEALLISQFAPVWNKIVDGFGNHNPGSGRHAGLIPRWDVLHPGRPWAQNLQPRQEVADDIARESRDYLRGQLN